MRVLLSSTGANFGVLQMQVRRLDRIASTQTYSYCSNDDDFDSDYRFGFNGQEKDNEIAGIGNSMDLGLRNYDTRLGRMWKVDPRTNEYPWQAPYAYHRNSPISMIDYLGGGDPSTHTDENGKVAAVFKDGDNSVYKHKQNKDGGSVTKEQLKKRRKKLGNSGGGTKMGETEYEDEFISPETGKDMTNYTIQFGKSFDGYINEAKKLSQDMNLKEIAANSTPGGKFDIKVKYANKAGLLNGKYVTSRSAGNYMAGHNASGATMLGVRIQFNTFQKMAGGLHVKGRLTKSEMAGIVFKGTSYGPAPAYGEVMYQYRMSKAGWFKARHKRYGVE